MTADPTAEAALRAAVDRLMHEPADDAALRQLGALAYRGGRVDAGADLARLAADPPIERADAYAHLGSVLRKLGRPADAVDSFRRALGERWNFPEALCDLGNTLIEAGHPAEAVACYRTALGLRPHDAVVLANLGSALRSAGQLDEAIGCLRHALELAPELVAAHVNLANALRERGDIDGAVAAYRAALALRPDDAELHRGLGGLLSYKGQLHDAIGEFERALALRPDLGTAHCQLGNAFRSLGDWPAARRSYEAARARAPRDVVIRSNILFALNYDPGIDEDALFEAHRAFGHEVAAPLMPAVLTHANRRDPARRLRVGYVSADLCRHPIGYFLLPALAAHDRAAIEAICYSGSAHEDDLTARLRGEAAGWQSTVGLDDAALAERIAADGIDILVDLAGHTGANRLGVFARKPAPVQVSWLGYFNTTGMPAIDYVVMGATCVLPGAERWFVERVVRLPTGRFCYRPPDDAPAVSAPPLLTTGQVTFGSFNNLGKLNDQVYAAWAAVVRAVPRSRLLLKWYLGDERQEAHVRASFTAHGLAPERLILRTSSPHVQMLAEYGEVDIGLDPFPYCGGLTSCEALWMGVPIVTLPGPRVVSRQTLGLLTQIGLPELIADSPERYVALAAGLAADPARLTDLRASLRPRMAASPVCDGAGFTRGLEAAYRAMWRDWCASGP